MPSFNLDWTSWQTWLIIALAGAFVYSMFFASDRRTRRKERSAALAEARERYRQSVAKIREQYAAA